MQASSVEVNVQSKKSNSALPRDPTYLHFKCLLEHIIQIIPYDDCLSILNTLQGTKMTTVIKIKHLDARKSLKSDCSCYMPVLT